MSLGTKENSSIVQLPRFRGWKKNSSRGKLGFRTGNSKLLGLFEPRRFDDDVIGLEYSTFDRNSNVPDPFELETLAEILLSRYFAMSSLKMKFC